MSDLASADIALRGTPPAAPLIAVDRAVADIRRGGVVLVTAAGHAPLLVQAAEAMSDEHIARLRRLAGVKPGSTGECPAKLFITGRRAAVLGLGDASDTAVELQLPSALDANVVTLCADPVAEPDPAAAAPFVLPETARAVAVPAQSPAAAGVLLAKIARLLPAVIGAELPPEIVAAAASLRAWASERSLQVVDAAAIRGYNEAAARSLRLVSEARVPLLDSEETSILSFRPSDGGIEHLAILIGQPDPEQPILVRLHSECFTGDLLGSLRCDCGDQLRGAIDAIATAGSGVLLYLAQEGRGIGLVNKLRAYRLQDDGFDTLDANGQLGFDDDERVYLPAAEMLRQLGFTRVRLMTNNPAKVEALGRHGVTVEERVPHVFAANPHNLSYLRTKALKGGHLF